MMLAASLVNLPPFHHHDNEREHVYKIPFWIGPERRLVSGIRKTTTCDDILRSLFPTSAEDPSVAYVIVEKWRKMERKLEPSARILKVWKAWGDQQDDVALIVKHNHVSGNDSITSTADGYIDKKSANKATRRRSSHRISTHEGGVDESGVTNSVERLLKLVLTQGETIQMQLKKLRSKEEQIEKYEEKMHLLRSLQEGENYVVESYLRDVKGSSKRHVTTFRKRDSCPRKSSSGDKKKEKSGRSWKESLEESPQLTLPQGLPNECPSNEPPITTADPPIPSFSQEKELMEKICEVNKKLTREEERLVKLGMGIKMMSEVTESGGGGRGPMKPRPQETELHQLLIELTALRQVTNEQNKEIEWNEQSLTALESHLDSRHDHLTHLSYQIHLIDFENDILQRRLQLLTEGTLTTKEDPRPTPQVEEGVTHDLKTKCSHHPCPVYKVTPTDPSHSNLSLKPSCRGEDNDSNSDTGISSLHSSGDEHSSLFVLDTLV